jgi:hypothetical protein
MQNLKDLIIYNIFEFLETKDNSFAEKAKEYILELGKKYHIPIKKIIRKSDLKAIFKRFILNNEGYSVVLPILFNSL